MSGALSLAIAQLSPRQGRELGGQEKPLKSRRKPVADENRSTTRVTARRLLTEADVLEAIRWRLTSVPDGDVLALAEVLRPLADDFREDRKEVVSIIGDLRYRNDRRAGWSLACAILAHDAASSDDLSLFWAAGVEVIQAMNQGRRGTHHNRKIIHTPDALDELIAVHRKKYPNITASALFDHFAKTAVLCNVIADYDADADTLVCQLNPRSEQLTDVTRNELARRFNRIISVVS